MNLSSMADAYKYSHPLMYPEDLTYLYSYAFARNQDAMLFGLQYLIKKYLAPENLGTYDTRLASYLGDAVSADFADRWDELMEVTEGKYLPIRIKSVPEGVMIGKGEALFTVENTDRRFPWLTTFVETLLLKCWYPSTIATRSRNLYTALSELWYANVDRGIGMEYLVHDFGYRGATSEESSALASAAHLLSFRGTDTTSGLYLLNEYYDIPFEKTAKTIPASEHSVMMMGSDETMISRILDTTNGVVSIVIDTHNYLDCLTGVICGTLCERIKNRTAPVVIRPDSGDPKLWIPFTLGSLEAAFGVAYNTQGKKVLKSVRVIWGDGLTPEKIVELMEMVIDFGFSPENIVFGMGGALHNGVDRDTLGFTSKVAQAGFADGHFEDVHKQAVGKETRAGRQQVYGGRIVYDNGLIEWPVVRL